VTNDTPPDLHQALAELSEAASLLDASSAIRMPRNATALVRVAARLAARLRAAAEALADPKRRTSAKPKPAQHQRPWRQ
jgi:hypothetical protein